VSRTEFLAALRAGLHGIPQGAVEEIISDYSAHFDEGATADRQETEIAAALGDPQVLAAELRMEMRIESFEAAPSVRSGVQVLGGALRQGFVGFLLLGAAALLLLIVPIAALVIVALMGVGGWFFVDGSSLELNGGFVTVVLCGVGLIAAAVSLAAFLMLAGRALVRAVSRYTRLHSRLIPRSPKSGTPS
jgi:uncharacterized membrane protein